MRAGARALLHCSSSVRRSMELIDGHATYDTILGVAKGKPVNKPMHGRLGGSIMRANNASVD
jgi:hypothetical protein